MRIPLISAVSAILLGLAGALSLEYEAVFPAVVAFVLILVVLASVRTAYPYERAVVLRNGRFAGMRGPGLFILTPVVDTVMTYVDTRIRNSGIKAEKALTSDTVAVDVDSIVFWQIHDPRKAALEVDDVEEAIVKVAQTSLREMIGRSDLTTLMSDGKAAEALLKDEIARKVADWGVDVTSVEIKDVSIPASLFDAMSRQAQAERESAARITLATSEQEIARQTALAAEIYVEHPIALQIRQMGLVYEMGKNGTTILVPTEMTSSLSGMAMAKAAQSIPGTQGNLDAALLPAGRTTPVVEPRPAA